MKTIEEFIKSGMEAQINYDHLAMEANEISEFLKFFRAQEMNFLDMLEAAYNWGLGVGIMTPEEATERNIKRPMAH